jgi:hypothetical protein
MGSKLSDIALRITDIVDSAKKLLFDIETVPQLAAALRKISSPILMR